MLKTCKEELKLLNIALGTELDKVDRPGHKRKARPAGGEKKDADGLTDTTSMSGNASGTPEKKECHKEHMKRNKKRGLKIANRRLIISALSYEEKRKSTD
eukprot:TRINITY_DN8768_c0_g1_i1.p1 TRINITY_DN8768_c0_g1~~TRINITY_DN8768_c0_g1_i1.p1  ORF type:complete len:110 (+),score=22.96 TRINITY_DN8768_c0_g1_i1:31-330(+)